MTVDALLQYVKKSTQYSFWKSVFNDIIADISKDGRTSVATLNYMFALCPEYKGKCIKEYNGIFGLNKYVNDIPDDVKACQGALFDCLCFGYDVEKSANIGLYGVSLNPINEVIDAKLEDKIMSLNRIGQFYSVRYDITYIGYSNSEFNLKEVKHRTVIDNEHVVLVPFTSVYTLMEIIRIQLSKGKILAVAQQLPSGEMKMRVISDNIEHIEHYSDDPQLCNYLYSIGSLSAEMFYLGAFLYAPVLGAPSTTGMKTRVEIFNIEMIQVINGYQQCSQFGVQKIKDPIDVMCKEQAILTTLANLRANDPDTFGYVINKLPESAVYGNMFDGDITPRTISNYLHMVKQGKVNEVLRLVPGAMESYETRKLLLNEKSTTAIMENFSDAREIKDLASTHILKIIWKKPNGVMASTVGTNNVNILKMLYGDDYFGKYESIGVCIRNACEDITDLGMPVDEACKAYGLDPSLADRIKEDHAQNKDSWEDSFYRVLGKKKRVSSSSENTILIRSISAYFGTKRSEGSAHNNAEDYYTSIDLNHLVSCTIVG